MKTAGLNQNQPQGDIQVLDLKNSPAGRLVVEEPTDRVETSAGMDPTELQIHLDKRLDQDRVLGWELLGLEVSQMPGLDSGTRRMTARSRLALKLQLLFQKGPG